MRFSRRGECDIVTRIAGPLHHYLGLRLIQDQGSGPVDPVLEDLSAAAENRPLPLSPNVVDLVTTVLAGVRGTNERLGTRYAAERIVFCSSDPYLKDTYRALTETLVEHVARQEQGSPHDLGPSTGGDVQTNGNVDEAFLTDNAREAATAEGKSGATNLR